CVNSACVERLFSCMGWFHNKYRNHLKPKKVLQMSQLRAAMNYRNNLKVIENSIKKFQDNIQLSQPQSDNSKRLTDSTQNNQDYAAVVSDSEDEEIQEERNNNAMSVEEWNEIVSKWITMIDDDEHAGNIIDHPSINKDAKWNLS
ncbi:14809_t:CDS:2, partial [Dentiscutata erythropus]